MITAQPCRRSAMRSDADDASSGPAPARKPSLTSSEPTGQRTAEREMETDGGSLLRWLNCWAVSIRRSAGQWAGLRCRCHRSLGVRPRPPVQEAAELPAPSPVGEVPVLEPLLDLRRVLVHRRAPLRVPLHARGVGDAELPGQILHGLPRHGKRVLAQEPADVADCADLQGHAQAVRVRTAQRDQVAVVIAEEEEPLQFRARGHLGERPVRLGLLISQKLHRHDRAVASTGATSRSAAPSPAPICGR